MRKAEANTNIADEALADLPKRLRDLLLYDGRAIARPHEHSVRLRVRACWHPRQQIEWRVTHKGNSRTFEIGPISFELKQSGPFVHSVVEGSVNRTDGMTSSGTIVGGSVVGPAADSQATVAHVKWLNLEDLGGGELLEHVSDLGRWRRWYGRQRWILGDWEMTADARPDLSEVASHLKEAGRFGITHLARLRRIDGTPFTGHEAQEILSAYQTSASFALGRGVAPVLASGRNADGDVIWQEWTARRVDEVAGVTSWWHPMGSAFSDIFSRLGPVLLDRERGRTAALIVHACVASSRGGFIEQRISTAFSALERLAWQRDILEDGRTDKREHMHKTMRRRMTAARIPLGIPPHLQALAKFAADENLGDVASALCEVRHRLTHPKSPSDLYDRPNLLTETWLATTHYLELLILHWIGFDGDVVDRSVLSGWAGTTKPAPWRVGPL